jgi:hypothetical protein
MMNNKVREKEKDRNGCKIFILKGIILKKYIGNLFF